MNIDGMGNNGSVLVATDEESHRVHTSIRTASFYYHHLDRPAKSDPTGMEIVRSAIAILPSDFLLG